MSRRGWVWGATAIMVMAALAAALRFRTGRPAERGAAESHEDVARQMLFKEIQPVALSNCQLERFGEVNDGGYLLCGNLLAGVGAGYSYGINGYDQWGCDVSKRLGVAMHQYDCFNTAVPVCEGGRTAFHAECVGPTANVVEEGRLFDTIERQTVKNGDGSRRLVMKMDVEGAEWDSFQQAPDSLFERIDQLVVEFHATGEDRFIGVLWRLKQFFHIAHLHINNRSCEAGEKPFPGWAYEVLLVNRKLGTADPSGGRPGPSPLDAPNDPKLPDCQIARP